MKQPTKEELVEMIGMAELLVAKLIDLDERYYAADVDLVARNLQRKFDRICGEEELARMRGEIQRCATCKYDGDSQYQSYCCSCKNGVDEDFYELKGKE